MLVQLIMAEGSVLCGAGVFLLRGQGEDFSGDHLAEKERDREAVLPAPIQSQIMTLTSSTRSLSGKKEMQK